MFLAKEARKVFLIGRKETDCLKCQNIQDKVSIKFVPASSASQNWKENESQRHHRATFNCLPILV
jgi:hypothetical protein